MSTDFLTVLADWIAGTIWPTRCAACGHIGAVACQTCLKMMLPLAAQRCPGCHLRSLTGKVCPSCTHQTHLDCIVCTTDLNDTAQAFVNALKYRGIQLLAQPLAGRMCDLVNISGQTAAVLKDNPLIVPVPLHKTRERRRGYNQSQLLAERIAASTALAVKAGALIRTRSTGQQIKTAGRAERLENMQGAFEVIERTGIAGKDCVLIDDVTTTGATLEDCARSLREAGARSVRALVFARKL